MRAALGVMLVASCEFSHGVPGGRGAAAIVDDTAADFAAGSAIDMTVDPLGTLAPDAFFLGGLHARAYAANNLVTPATTWTSLQPTLPAPLGEAYGVLPINWSGDRPYGVGITTSRLDAFTLVVDGELHLPAGTTTLALVADDAGFIEIDVGATRAGIHARYQDAAPPTMTVEVAAAGWYPIRGAVSEAGGEAKLQLSIIDGATPRPVMPSELRARVTTAQGVSVVASNDRLLASPVAGIAVEPTLVDRTFTNAPGYDFAAISGQYYSLRYAGQLRIDAEDAQTFALDLGGDATDYARLVIDGNTVAGRWPGRIDQLTSDPVPLAPGWHDLILDYAQATGTERVKLTMGSAPIPADHLRPVRNGGLLARSVNTSTIALVDGGTKTIDMPMTMPAGATIELVDVFFQLANQPRTAMMVDVIDGAKSDALAIPEKPAYENMYDAFPGRRAFAGAASEPMWQLAFTDLDPMATGPYVFYPALIASYRGGPDMPFATTMTYVSGTREVTGTIVDARAVGKLDGVAVTLDVRTGTAAAIDAASWQAPPLESEGVVQYRVSIDNDGWHYPEIDRVELDVQ